MSFAFFLNSSDVLSFKLSLHLIFSIRILRSRSVSRNKNVHSEVNPVFNYIVVHLRIIKNTNVLERLT